MSEFVATSRGDRVAHDRRAGPGARSAEVADAGHMWEPGSRAAEIAAFVRGTHPRTGSTGQ